MKLICDVTFPEHRKAEFEDIQWKSWEIAGNLNPKCHARGFNVNMTYQCEIYPEHDFSPAEEWAPGDLTWTNFVNLFPEYISFVQKYNFYPGITMISRPVYFPHRHGRGEHTLTYPLQGCDDVKVFMLTPDDLAGINERDIHWLKNGETYKIDLEYQCVTGKPFILKGDHFHKTSEHPEFIDGTSIFTVWHELSTFTDDDVEKFKVKMER